MSVSKNKGTPKWMVKIMENPIKMDDLGGKPAIFGNTHIYIYKYTVYIHHPSEERIFNHSTVQDNFVAGHRKGLLNSLRRSSNAAVPLSINSWSANQKNSGGCSSGSGSGSGSGRW